MKLAILVAAVLVLPASAGAGTEDLTLPNLVPIPPNGIMVGVADQPEDVDEPQPEHALRFNTTTFNEGEYALDLIFAPESPEDVLQNGRDILQCVHFVADPVCTEYRSVGRAFYHEIHGHWHMEHYAEYLLLPVTPDGLPDFAASPIVPSAKASFCIIDTNAPEGSDSLRFGTYTECSSIRQGMTSGYGDTYGSGLYGQQLVIDGVPSGTYGVVIVINPVGRLYETTEADNRSWAVIELTEDETCETGYKVTVLETGVS